MLFLVAKRTLWTPDVVDVRSKGALLNGTTDDSAAFLSAIDTGKPVYVPYTSTGAVVSSLRPAASTNKLVIFSDDRRMTLKGSGTKTGQGVLLNNTTAPANCEVDIRNLRFTNYELAIYQDANHSHELKLRVEGCTIDTCKRGIWCVANVVRADVLNNVITDIVHGTTSAGAIVLGDIADDTYEDTAGKFYVTGNVIENVDSASASESHAIWLAGIYAEASSNRIDFVDATGNEGNGAEAIYTKCRYVRILSNTIIDGGHGQGSITNKGASRSDVSTNPFGFGCEIAHNTIVRETAGKGNIGISSFCSDTNIHHNRIENLQWQTGATDGGAAIYVPNATINRLIVEHNQIYGCQTRYGIFWRGSGTGNRCENNTIEGHTGHASDTTPMVGILFQNTAAATEELRCNGNTVRFASPPATGATVVRGIRWLGAAAGSYDAVSIEDNLVDLDDGAGYSSTCFEITEAADSTYTDMLLANNRAKGTYETAFNLGGTHGTRTQWMQRGNSWGHAITAGANDLTPSVENLNQGGVLVSNNSTSLRTITNFDDGYEGQEFTYHINDAFTAIADDDTNIELSGNVTFSPGGPAMIRFLRRGSKWREVSRTVY